MSGPESNLEAAAAFVDYGLGEQAEGRRESSSGPGSSLRAASAASNLLLRKLRDLPIHSVLDLGCGDWNWTQHLGFPHPIPGRRITYEGWEAAPKLVDSLRAKYGQDGVDFHVRDVSTETFPKVDLIIARDVLFHMPPEIAARVIEKIKKSCKYFAAPSFIFCNENESFSEYLEIEKWGFSFLNMNVEPYSLAPYMQECVLEPYCSHKEKDRYFCFYTFGPDEEPDEEGDTPESALMPPSIKSAEFPGSQISAVAPDLSVIVTSHNNADTIENTVRSISGQEVQDIEIIILDDRSHDTSWYKIESLARWDERIKPIRSDHNLGPSAMRNIAISYAQGEYVCFVDGDDALFSGGLTQLLQRARSVSADVVRGSHISEIGGNSGINEFEQFHQPEVLRTCYADMPSLVQLYTSWNMLIRRSLIQKNDLQFRLDLRLGEDRIFNQQVFNAARSISLTKFGSYKWVRYAGARNSGTHLSSGRRTRDRLASISGFLDVLVTLENATPVHFKMGHTSMAFELAACEQKAEREGLDFLDEIEGLWERIILDPHWLTNPSIKGYARPLFDLSIKDRIT